MFDFDKFNIPALKNPEVKLKLWIQSGVHKSLLSVFVFSLATVALLHFSSSDLIKEIDQLRFVTKNWEQKVILDILLAHNENCPSGYENLIASEGWHGINEGCDCSQSHISKILGSNIYQGPCDVKPKLKQDVLRYPGLIRFTTETFKDRQICMKKADFSFLELQYPRNNECPEDYKLCGSEDPNSQTLFCQSIRNARSMISKQCLC